MKKNILVLLTLFALIPSAQLLAQAPPVAQPPAKGVADPAPDLAPLLVSPSGEQTETPSDLIPESSYILCTSSEECPTGELCCNVCGALPFGDPSSCMRCVEPVRKRCPLVV
jgi:hypothetical protein